MVLPSAPSLAAAPKTTELSEQESASDEGVPASDDQEQNLEVDDPNNSETESKAVVKNGSDEKNGSDAVESLDSNTMEDVKIKREDIVAQVWKFSHNQIIICRLVKIVNSALQILVETSFCCFCFVLFCFVLNPLLLLQNTILQNITYNARLIMLLYLQNNTYDTYNVGYSC